jgi:hypothetical protein
VDFVRDEENIVQKQQRFKDFKRFGAFKGLVEQKKLYSTRSCVNWAFYGIRGLKILVSPRFKLIHSCHKVPTYTRTR